ncbi:MAG: TlpA disulfide reductase family protein [Acidimicrobiia bacterium]|nr:TlpA disulfide reductase family protein [Acidimicrobiia bacterium]
MKRPIRLAGMSLAILILASACAATGGETSREGDPAPDTTFATFAGETVSLAAYEGRPLVVNFWASWCPSCVAEMSAAFLPAQEQLGDQVAFLGMNIQDERAKALELVAETGVLFDLAEDREGALYSALGGLGMPFTVFISADGQVVAEHNGPLTRDQLIDEITEVLLS